MVRGAVHKEDTMRARMILAALLAFLSLAAACGEAEDAGQPVRVKEGPTITIGSANFSESVILAQIYTQALRKEGYKVDTKLNIGAREVYIPALERGEIDFIPEYTGNLLRFFTKKEEVPTGKDETGEDRLLQALLDEAAKHKLFVLQPAPAQDTDAVVVTKETAERLNLKKVSDLAAHDQDLVFGGTPECPQRPACLKGLHDVYGLKFKEEKALEPGPTTVTALDDGALDVANIFSTDGAIAARGFVVLEDDKGIAGEQKIVPLVRREIMSAYDTPFAEFVDKVSAKITTGDLTKLNKRADVDKEDPDQIAASWLRDNGFI
jgi:osmoprotectant transport system substrate-binding protein